MATDNKESVNQKLTSELYTELRDKGYTHEQIKQAWSNTDTPKMTKDLYGSLRDKGYTHEQIKAGEYSRVNLMPWITGEKAGSTFSSWSKTANDFTKWSSSQPNNWSSWNPEQATTWAETFRKNAEQAKSILEDLTKQGAKAGIEEYDAYQGYYDYFSQMADQLLSNNESFYTYRDNNMYHDEDTGKYYSYEDVIRMENDINYDLAHTENGAAGQQASGFLSGLYRSLSGLGIDVGETREKKEQLKAMDTWLGNQNKLRDQAEWYAGVVLDNPDLDTGKYYAQAEARKTEADAKMAELEKTKPNLYTQYAKVDELGNIYDYDYDAYNKDLAAWEAANADFLSENAAAQRDYSYASSPDFRFYTVLEHANEDSPAVQAAITRGKAIAEGLTENDAALEQNATDVAGAAGSEYAQAYWWYKAGSSERKHINTDTWSDDKKNAYYFLLGTGQDASAERLAQITNDAISAEALMKQFYEPIDKFQKNHPVLGDAAATIAGVVIPLYAGTPEFMSNAFEYAVTGEIDPSKATPMQLSQRLVANTAGKLNQVGTLDSSIPVIGGKGLGDLYQLGISILQSALSRRASGGMEAIVLTQFFGSAATSGIYEGLDNGLDPGRALMLGTMNGAAEALGEKLSLEQLLKIKDSTRMRKLFTDVLIQAGIEGSEEAFTTVLNTLADLCISADKAELRVAVDSYMSQGKSREEAEKLAIKDWLNGIAFDALGGAISGGVSAAGTSIMRNIGTYRGSTRYLMDLAEQTDEGSKSREMLPRIQDEYARKTQRKIKGRRNISAWHGNQFAQQVMDDLKGKNTDTAVRAIRNRLSELGETGDIQQKAQVMADYLIGEMSGDNDNGFSLKISDKFSANATAKMQQVMNELSEARENFAETDYEQQNEKWTDEIMKGRFLDEKVLYGDRYSTANYHFGRALEQISDLEQEISEAKKELETLSPTDTERRAELKEQIKTAESELKKRRGAILEDGYNSYSEEEKTATVDIDGSEYKVSGLTMEQGNEAKVKLEGPDGKTVILDIDDTRLPLAFRSLAVKVKSLGWAAEPAFRFYKAGTNVNAYIDRIQSIKTYASEKISSEAFMETAAVKALDNAPLAEFLYSEGQNRYANLRS